MLCFSKLHSQDTVTVTAECVRIRHPSSSLFPLRVVFLGLAQETVMLKGCHKPHLMFLAALRMPGCAERAPCFCGVELGGLQPAAGGGVWCPGWLGAHGAHRLAEDQWNRSPEALASGNSCFHPQTLHELMTQNISPEQPSFQDHSNH